MHKLMQTNDNPHTHRQKLWQTFSGQRNCSRGQQVRERKHVQTVRTVCSLTTHVSSCTVLSHDHEKIKCIMPPAPGAVYAPDVIVGHQSSNVSVVFYNYEANRLVPDVGPLRGGTMVTVVGEVCVWV